MDLMRQAPDPTDTEHTQSPYASMFDLRIRQMNIFSIRARGCRNIASHMKLRVPKSNLEQWFAGFIAGCRGEMTRCQPLVVLGVGGDEYLLTLYMMMENSIPRSLLDSAVSPSFWHNSGSIPTASSRLQNSVIIAPYKLACPATRRFLSLHSVIRTQSFHSTYIH